MTPTQIARLQRLFVKDMEALFKLVFSHQRPVSEADIRLAVTVLRKWLTDGGLLGRLCHLTTVTPTFPIIDNDLWLETLRSDPELTYALTGGVRFDGKAFKMFYHSSSAEPLPAIKEMRLPTYKMASLGEFLNQTRIVFEASNISLQEIITFTANKIGGAHFDDRRNERQAFLEKAANYMCFGGPLNKIETEPSGEIYLILEPEGTEVLSGFHVEVIAAATSLIQLSLNDEPLLDVHVNREWHGQRPYTEESNKEERRYFSVPHVNQAGGEEK